MTRFKLISLSVLLLPLLVTLACTKPEDAMSRIRKERAVAIATHPVNEPMEFGKGTGVQGFDVDIGEEIANTLGVKTRWVKATNFNSLFDMLQKHEADMVISSISIIPERQKSFAFSEPYYTSGQVVAVRSDNKEIKALDNLKGKKVGVEGGTTGESFIKKSDLPGVQLKTFLTLEDALQALSAREIDAVVGDYPIVAYLVYKRYSQLKTVGNRVNEEKYGVMLRPEDKELLDIVNRTIKRLQESGKYNEIVKSWFGEFELSREAQLKKAQEMAAAMKTPKVVTFRILRSQAYKEFDMSRLDGFQIVLHGRDSDRVITSTPVLTQGNSGRCQLNALPGKYSLSFKPIGLNAELEIPMDPAKNVTFTINISRGGVSIEKT